MLSSFPRKSYFKFEEMTQIIGEPESFALISSLLSETGHKLYLREDVLKLYMNLGSRKQELYKTHGSELMECKEKFHMALEQIAQIKKTHFDSWAQL